MGASKHGVLANLGMARKLGLGFALVLLLTLAVAGFAILMSLLTLAALRLPQLAPVWALGLTRRRLAALEMLRAAVPRGAAAVAAVLRKSQREAEGMLRVPTAPMIAWVMLQQGPTYAAARLLRALRSEGLAVAIDDFGTGYSSLSYLKQFPADVVKIDRTFVSDVVNDPDSAALTQAIVAMAHGLKLKTVAEGVPESAFRVVSPTLAPVHFSATISSCPVIGWSKCDPNMMLCPRRPYLCGSGALGTTPSGNSPGEIMT